MHTTRGRMYLLVGSFGLWVLVTSSLAWQELSLGVVVALIVTFAVGRGAEFFGGIRSPVSAIVALPPYLLRFIWKLILANLDVARRVLSPQVPVQPGIVAVRTGISSDIGRLLLANSITLTPGTLTLDAGTAVASTPGTGTAGGSGGGDASAGNDATGGNDASAGNDATGGGVLYVHWIDAPREGDTSEEVAGAFEAGLERIVE
ncbi:MAG: Na+/H+ antiporter subunit E [Alkalispirochaeta sp.]